jgi:hypothetical protein
LLFIEIFYDGCVVVSYFFIIPKPNIIPTTIAPMINIPKAINIGFVQIPIV